MTNINKVVKVQHFVQKLTFTWMLLYHPPKHLFQGKEFFQIGHKNISDGLRNMACPWHWSAFQFLRFQSNQPFMGCNTSCMEKRVFTTPKEPTSWLVRAALVTLTYLAAGFDVNANGYKRFSVIQCNIIRCDMVNVDELNWWYVCRCYPYSSSTGSESVLGEIWDKAPSYSVHKGK